MSQYWTLFILALCATSNSFRFRKQNGPLNCKNLITPLHEYEMFCQIDDIASTVSTGVNNVTGTASEKIMTIAFIPDIQKVTVNIAPGEHCNIECENIYTIDYKHVPRGIFENDESDIKYFSMNKCPLTPIVFPDILLHQNITTTMSFSISNANYKDIKRRHFIGLSRYNVTDITIVNCSIGKIPSSLFKDLKNLLHLRLNDNNIHLPKGVFDPLINLQMLYLDKNNLTELPDGIFSKLTALKKLDLSENILNLRKSTFEGMENLEDLNLNKNAINLLPEDTFEYLKKLSIIKLNENRFTQLPILFKTNHDLTYFMLVDNKETLKSIPERMLSNMKKLTEVKLYKNGIETIPENMFEGSPKITNISLTNNKIETLPELIFGDKRNLKSLSLSYNRIKMLPTRIFENLIALLDLDIAHNNIKQISGSIFKSLLQLKSLNMRYNMIVNVDFLQGLKDLRSLDMSHNILSWEQQAEEFTSPFHNLDRLESLTLSYNNIKTICKDWKERDMLPDLKNLDLSHNLIHEITEFKDVQIEKRNEFKLDLTNNDIQRITLDEKKYKEPLNNVRIIIDNNPLICDCLLLTFMQYIRRPEDVLDKRPKIHFMLRHGRCAYPDYFTNKTIESLQYNDLECEYKNDGYCSYIKRPIERARVILCVNGAINKEHRIPSLGSEDMFEYNHTELHLDNNNMKRLSTFGRISTNVTKLYLNGNNLTSLKIGDVPPYIEVLDLRNNSIVHVSTAMANMTVNGTKLKELWISGNPIACDCTNHAFLSLLESHHDKVKDYTTLKCPNGTHILHLKLSLLCLYDFSNYTSLIIILCLVGATLTILWGLTLFYYNCKNAIKLWLHNHVKWTRKFILRPNPPDIDSMKYDVFVSGSHLDNEIIVRQVIPHLEKDGYKVCWHERDWRIGDFIIDSIQASIQESQTTLFFVTENFVKSTWSCQEFRFAVSTAVSRGCFNLIVILHDDLGTVDEMESTLRNYLKNNTYLKWDDKSFWGRLTLSLPQRLCDVQHHKTEEDENDKDQSAELINSKADSNIDERTNNTNVDIFEDDGAISFVNDSYETEGLHCVDVHTSDSSKSEFVSIYEQDLNNIDGESSDVRLSLLNSAVAMV